MKPRQSQVMGPKFIPMAVPLKGSPLLKLLAEEVNKQEMSRNELQRLSGVDRSGFLRFIRNGSPGVFNLEVLFAALGYKLVPVLIEKE